jgi:hypothetical protein
MSARRTWLAASSAMYSSASARVMSPVTSAAASVLSRAPSLARSSVCIRYGVGSTATSR